MKRVVLILWLNLCLLGVNAFGQEASTTGVGKKTIWDNYYYGGNQPDLIGKKEHARLRSGSEGHKCFNCNSTHSGDGKFSCATTEAEEIMRKKYPGKANTDQFESFINRKKKASGLRSSTASDVYVVPVIVHVVYYEGQAIGVDHNITAAQVASQIEVLNEDYRKKINTRGYNVDPVGADARIEFVPALYDPYGNLLPEPGINRVKAEGITDGSYFLNTDSRFVSTGTAGWIKANTSWEPNCYLNLWTMGLANGVLGFASFPDTDLPGIAGLDLPDPEYDGVVIDYRRFGSYEKGPFPGAAQSTMGRAASHELGHFFGLRHTWGDAPSDTYGQYPDGCSYDDYVEDTPNSKQPMYVNMPLYLCGAREMVENQMDYSSDFVKNIFTQQQIERMHIVLDNSPRRKQLLTSTVADKNGDKTPTVTLNASNTRLNVYDVFAFNALVERFPGRYKWEFEGGVPATSTSRTPGVYFETPGTKQVKLTVENKFGSVSKTITVNVTENHACDVMYASTLSSLQPIMPNFSFGGYLTGHGDIFGVKFIANRFTLPNDPTMQYITQLEMDFARFITKPAFDPDTTFTVYVAEESYDSICINKTSTSDNYEIFSPVSYDTPQGGREVRSIDPDNRDAIILKLKSTPDMTYDIQETPTLFIAKARRPGKVLAMEKIRVGDAFKAFQNDKPLRILLDNPVRPETKNFYLVLDTDYDYFLPRKSYAFDLKAGISPFNFCWGKAITQETVHISYPKQWTYEWAPYTMSEPFNGWGVSVLMHFLPVYYSTNNEFEAPVFDAPELTDPNTTLNFTAPEILPAGIKSCKWTFKQPNGKVAEISGSKATYTFTEAGTYDVTLTYIGKTCLQRSLTKQVKVKGIKFNITTSESGSPVYCPGKKVTLKVNEETKTGTSATYKWYGGNLDGAEGLTQVVAINATTSFRVDAADNSGATASESIVVELNTQSPVSKFKVLTPHLQRGDTLDIYIVNSTDRLQVENLSENVSHYYNYSGVLVKDFNWVVDGYGLKSFVTRYNHNNNISYNYDELLTSISDGPGLYRVGLEVANRGCSSATYSAVAAPDAKKDTSYVYLNFKAQSSFGEMSIMANGNKMSVAPPPAYPSFYGYTSYVETGGSVTLEAVSDEITEIKWTNSYSGKTYDTKKIQVDDVRDNQSFTVEVTRSRNSENGHIDFKETLDVLVLLQEKAPTEKATVSFRPHLDSICPGTAVKFINTSRNTTAFEWKFEGGIPAEDEKNFDISNLWAPNRLYDKPGDYKATLTVTSYDGSTSSMERIIHVGEKVIKPQLRFGTSAKPAKTKIVGDTIYAYTRGAFLLVMEGTGIAGIEKYENYQYIAGAWNWRDMEAKQNHLFRPGLTFFQEYSGPTYPAEDGLQRVRINARTCGGELLTKEIYIKFTHLPSIDIYSLEINGSPQLLENIAELQKQVSCAGNPVKLEVKCSTEEIKNGTDIVWYRLNEKGERAELLSRSFQLTVSPQVNTTYEVTFVNKIGEGFTYRIPVQVGISSSEVRVMNIDLEKNSDNKIELPRDYKTPVILWVDDVVRPTWNKEGSSTVLSSENALVVNPTDGVYEVKAKSVNGDCVYSTKITIVSTKDPDPDPDPDPTPDSGSEIEMYPVPAYDNMTIENPYSGTAYIVDGLGRLVKSMAITPGKFTFSVKEYAAGVYTFVVRTGKDKDEKIISRNFVVVH